jgi:cation diffusion facilitator family transporter
MRIVLAIGFLLLCIKFYAWHITGSVAIFSDALESIVNVVSGLVTLLSVVYAAKPKDADHPYGHGKMEFIAAGFEGALVLMAGLLMLISGIRFLVAPNALTALTAGLLLSALAGLVNGAMGLFLINKGKHLSSPALIADGKHLLTDMLSSVGLIVSLLLVKLSGWVWIDGLASIGMGLWILFTGWSISKSSIGSLLDKADTQRVEEIVSLLSKNRRDKWIDFHNLRVQQYGSHIHVDCHITLPWYDSLDEAHQEVHAVHDLLKKEALFDIEFFIHADPCVPDSCSICVLSACPHRKKPFSQQKEWNLENLQANKKHKLEISS